MRINIRTLHVKNNKANMVSVFCFHKINRNTLWKYTQYILEILMYSWVVRFHCSWVYKWVWSCWKCLFDIHVCTCIIRMTRFSKPNLFLIQLCNTRGISVYYKSMSSCAVDGGATWFSSMYLIRSSNSFESQVGPSRKMQPDLHHSIYLGSTAFK